MFYSCSLQTDLFETIWKYDAEWSLISDLVQYN